MNANEGMKYSKSRAHLQVKLPCQNPGNTSIFLALCQTEQGLDELKTADETEILFIYYFIYISGLFYIHLVPSTLA